MTASEAARPAQAGCVAATATLYPKGVRSFVARPRRWKPSLSLCVWNKRVSQRNDCAHMHRVPNENACNENHTIIQRQGLSSTCNGEVWYKQNQQHTDG